MVVYSVVIPAFNEENRLPSTLESVCKFMPELKRDFEVIVVDDGSSDRTSEIVRAQMASYPELKLITFEKNRGKGAAVREGILAASGDFVLFNDADGATPISEFSRLLTPMERGADVVIGSRALASSETRVVTSWHRKFIGRTFNTLVNILIVPGVADTQCGFKLFRREAARQIFSLQRADRFSFDVEVLFLARKLGLKIVEQSVNWQNVPGSKVNLIHDSLQMFRDILRFRWWYFRGLYAI